MGDPYNQVGNLNCNYKHFAKRNSDYMGVGVAHSNDEINVMFME